MKTTPDTELRSLTLCDGTPLNSLSFVVVRRLQVTNYKLLIACEYTK